MTEEKQPEIKSVKVNKIEVAIWKRFKDAVSEPGLSRKAVFIFGVRLGISLKAKEK